MLSSNFDMVDFQNRFNGIIRILWCYKNDTKRWVGQSNEYKSGYIGNRDIVDIISNLSWISTFEPPYQLDLAMKLSTILTVVVSVFGHTKTTEYTSKQKSSSSNQKFKIINDFQFQVLINRWECTKWSSIFAKPLFATNVGELWMKTSRASMLNDANEFWS